MPESRSSTEFDPNELPFDAHGVNLADMNLAELEQAVVDAFSDSNLPPSTIPMDDIAGEWLLLTDINGPARLPSNWPTGTDGKANTLSLQIERRLNPEDLSGIVERVNVWESQDMYEKFAHPATRLLMERGGSLGVLFTHLRTKAGNPFWKVTFCRTADLPGLLPRQRPLA